ncbi:hypothetical protein Tco_1401114 [Tanacetum coccineum]
MSTSSLKAKKTVYTSLTLFSDAKLNLTTSSGKSAFCRTGSGGSIGSMEPTLLQMEPAPADKQRNDNIDTYDPKCLADPTLQVPLDEIRVDAKMNFMEEPVEILEREFKKLKRSRIAIVKVWWNSKRGPEFMWEREDQMKLKYPHLFSDVSS